MSACGFRTLLIFCVVAAFFFVVVACGSKAAAADITDAPAFLARRGLVTNPVELEVVDKGDPALVGSTYGPDAWGASDVNHVYLRRDIVASGGIRLAQIALHEYLHEASVFRWSSVQIEEYWNADPEAWRRREEGLVEAVTLDLVSDFYHYLTGRRFPCQASPIAYLPMVQVWRMVSKRMTGQGWRSKAAREWRATAITWGPARRLASLN